MSVTTRCGCTGRVVRTGGTVWIYHRRYGWHNPAASAQTQHAKFRPAVLMGRSA